MNLIKIAVGFAFAASCVSSFSAAYEKQDADFGHKTVYFESYENVVKQGVNYKTNKPFQYKDGYIIYTEKSAGTPRRAACLADMCSMWTNDPKSFEKYRGKRAKVKTDERLEGDLSEEVFMEIKILTK